MRKITEYFRNAVAAASQPNIDYKDEKFITITYESLLAGFIPPESAGDLSNGKSGSLNIIIALKTLSTKFSDSTRDNEDIDEMTSILFVPAKLSTTGKLYMPDDDKMPWIPREFLSPMIDPQISIGSIRVYDLFFETTTDVRNQIDSWKDYLIYAVDLFEFVTNSPFSAI